jgi:predicted nuclease with RNAse H fold
VLTVGVDLAAEPTNTAVARIRWTDDSAEVQAVGVGVDDPVLVDEITASDKAGIDCPLGWPRRFVEFVAQHQAGLFVAPVDIAGKDWRRRLALRETDLVVRAATGLIPLSVAADRIGLAAMRCAGLLARLAAVGAPVDRSGGGVVVEVYPAAALKQWGLTYRGYKGTVNAAVRHRLVDTLTATAPWLALGDHDEKCAGPTMPWTRSSPRSTRAPPHSSSRPHRTPSNLARPAPRDGSPFPQAPFPI